MLEMARPEPERTTATFSALPIYKDQNRNQAFTYNAFNRLTSAQNAGTGGFERPTSGWLPQNGNWVATSHVIGKTKTVNHKEHEGTQRENLEPTPIDILMRQPHANLCPPTRKSRVEGPVWDDVC